MLPASSYLLASNSVSDMSFSSHAVSCARMYRDASRAYNVTTQSDFHIYR